MPSPQETFDEALQEANTRIAGFLTSERPAIQPLLKAFASVAPFLPCVNPTAQQGTELQQYRKNLLALQAGIPQLKERLLARRAVVAAKLRGLTAARAYQQSTAL
jgi:hypothetical protein